MPENNDQTTPNPDPTQTAGLDIDFSDPQIDQKPIEQYTAEQATTPELPPGTEQAHIPMEEKPGEAISEDVTDITAPTKAPEQAQTYKVADQDVADLLDISPSTYTAFTEEGVTGEVSAASLMRYQLAELMQDVEAGNAPWADAAARKADQLMLKRGVGASTMAGAAISQAILEAAMPIAQYDAGVHGQMDIQNLRNRQEAMLSNVAAQNAAAQFNASNTQELDTFMAEMRDRVLRFNAEQMNQMEQFNVDQANAVNMFYDKMQNETDKFISENKLAIAKSNAEWRRTINLTNTAAENAALQQNVQNRFNLSQQAVAEMWQRARDVFNWANETSENAKDRAFKVALYTLQRDDYLADMEDQDKRDFFSSLGGLAADIISDINWGDLFPNGHS